MELHFGGTTKIAEQSITQISRLFVLLLDTMKAHKMTAFVSRKDGLTNLIFAGKT